MKKLLVAGFALLAVAAHAQKTPPKKKPAAPAKATATPPLKNLNDSASYAIGVSVATFYAQQGVTGLNTALVSKAMQDVYAKRTLAVTEAQSNDIMMKMMNKAQAEKSKSAIAAGEAFLANNRKNPNVHVTPSGLQYEVIEAGSGPKPMATDTVTVNYKGLLLDGSEFDNSYKRGEPLSLPLNRVIPGWTEGVQLMSKGAKYKFYIPYQLGYGLNGAGQSIPGGAVLVFEVELLAINGK